MSEFRDASGARRSLSSIGQQPDGLTFSICKYKFNLSSSPSHFLLDIASSVTFLLLFQQGSAATVSVHILFIKQSSQYANNYNRGDSWSRKWNAKQCSSYSTHSQLLSRSRSRPSPPSPLRRRHLSPTPIRATPLTNTPGTKSVAAWGK